MTAAPAPTRALHTSLTVAIEHALGHAGVDPLLAPSRQLGVDVQANFAMKLAKRLGRKPREIAEQVTAALGDVDGLLAGVEFRALGL
jgi:arginyl-tRNA synthetase